MDAIHSHLPGGLMMQPLVRFLLEQLIPSLDDFGYVGVGLLSYGTPDEGRLRLNLSAADEATLFQQRVAMLRRHPANWGEHHHLAGTTEETNAGRKGNYTVLVSDWPLTPSGG